MSETTIIVVDPERVVIRYPVVFWHRPQFSIVEFDLKERCVRLKHSDGPRARQVVYDFADIAYFGLAESADGGGTPYGLSLRLTDNRIVRLSPGIDFPLSRRWPRLWEECAAIAKTIAQSTSLLRTDSFSQ